MNQEHLEISLEGIRQLLSHLHGEITVLEKGYSEVLLVLQRMEGLANLDDLTGLLRRKAFFHRWQLLLDECQRLNESTGVLLIDIDHFKAVNDTHGHPTGDEVIRSIAALLKKFEAPTVVAGRFGGEEFAVAMRGSDNELRDMAEAIRHGAEHLHGPIIDEQGNPHGQTEWHCTLSVGLASNVKSGYDAKKMLAAADQALYSAKRLGRNRVQAA